LLCRRLLTFVETKYLYVRFSQIYLQTSNEQVARYLNERSTFTDVMGAINALWYHGGYPFTAEAFQLATDVVFTEENGDRPGATNYIILFTGSMEVAEFDLPTANDLQHDKVRGHFTYCTNTT
jgi:hypothetical protein